jgi:hypothetical protein
MILILVASPAAAQTPGEPARESGGAGRRAQLVQRVRQGARAGEITRAEVSRIRQRLAAWQTNARLARADGRITTLERKRLRSGWQRTSRLVSRLRHNNIRR